MTENEQPRSRRKKVVALSVGVAVVVGSAGVAYAYWTNDGVGTGNASTGTNDPVTVNQTGTVTGLKPGSTPVALTGTIDNPMGNGTVQVGTLSAVIGTVTKQTGTLGTCDTSDYTISGSPVTVNASIPAGSNVAIPTGLTVSFNNKAAVNQNACKNATLTISYATSTN